MFAVDAVAQSSLPFTAKSTLQALLKSREHTSAPKKLDRSELPSTSLVTDNSSNSSNSCMVPTTEGNITNGEQSGDFSYSQKLFHIADGNLYSIFSPLQGRSYGMKPSFLRKQRCTVQECHGKGRRVLRKGLKFHNFLPSESVTSEKDSSYLQDQWRVHSECKLREEHGTKQIMVSNWFQSVRQSGENSSPTDSTRVCESSSSSPPPNNETAAGSVFLISSGDCVSEHENFSQCTTDIAAEKNFNQEHEYLPSTAKSTSSTCKLQKDKQKFLDNLLETVSNCQTSLSATAASPKLSITSSIPHCGSKHRRKPNQTRRVVPYTKYLSILEESEAHPLDLSVHSRYTPQPDNFSVQSVKPVREHASHQSFGFGKCCELSESQKTCNLKRTGESATCNRSLPSQTPHLQVCTLSLNGNITPLKQNSLAEHKKSASGNKPSLLQSQLMTLVSEVPVLNHVKDNHCPSFTNISVQSSSATSTTAVSKPRRKSQRSVIKQKLEDTFRQNGFLVKTKQVSDGEATFCKFRQLRKYTRYYLKSWQHHLPDEVHKMWKGFLPPKTVMPPTAGNSQIPMDEQT